MILRGMLECQSGRPTRTREDCSRKVECFTCANGVPEPRHEEYHVIITRITRRIKLNSGPEIRESESHVSPDWVSSVLELTERAKRGGIGPETSTISLVNESPEALSSAEAGLRDKIHELRTLAESQASAEVKITDNPRV